MKVVKLFSLSRCIGAVAKFLIKIGLREDAKVGLSEWTLGVGGNSKGFEFRNRFPNCFMALI